MNVPGNSIMDFDFSQILRESFQENGSQISQHETQSSNFQSTNGHSQIIEKQNIRQIQYKEETPLHEDPIEKFSLDDNWEAPFPFFFNEPTTDQTVQFPESALSSSNQPPSTSTLSNPDVDEYLKALESIESIISKAIKQQNISQRKHSEDIGKEDFNGPLQANSPFSEQKPNIGIESSHQNIYIPEISPDQTISKESNNITNFVFNGPLQGNLSLAEQTSNIHEIENSHQNIYTPEVTSNEQISKELNNTTDCVVNEEPTNLKDKIKCLLEEKSRTRMDIFEFLNGDVLCIWKEINDVLNEIAFLSNNEYHLKTNRVKTLPMKTRKRGCRRKTKRSKNFFKLINDIKNLSDS